MLNYKLFNYFILITIFILSLSFTGCQQNGNDAVININNEELKSLITKESELVIVDVREQWEYDNGHIPEAVLIPLTNLEDNHQKLDKNSKIVLVCRSGNRSSKAANYLANKSFSNIYNFEGGMQDWTGPIENN